MGNEQSQSGMTTSFEGPAARYGARTTGDDVVADYGTHAAGKTALITGANSGLGFETARCLAAAGATVVVACRSTVIAEETAVRLRKIVKGSTVIPLELNLSSLSDVAQSAREFVESGMALHFLILNAGIMATPDDGQEAQFAVNHVAHFLLANSLLQLLRASAPSRIISLSSAAQYIMAAPAGPFLWDDPEKTRRLVVQAASMRGAHGCG
jgi:NAD(P)-dependent dehydrogenase (short-subunit alcohol dehydrogenase family)